MAEASQDPGPYPTDRLYEVAKWLLGVFGALAAALVALVPLSDFGELSTTSERFDDAVLGMILALGGTLAVIGLAAWTMASGFTDFRKIAAAKTTWLKVPAPLTASHVKRFFTDDESGQRLVKWLDYAGLDALAADFNNLSADKKEKREAAEQAVEQLLPLMKYLSVKHRLDTSIVLTFVAVLVAMTGAAMFTYNVRTEDPPSIDEAQFETVIVRPTAEGQELIAGGRGAEGCAGDEIEALLIEDGEDGDDVLFPPEGRCEGFRLTITEQRGVVEALPE
jgi:hypothetical protein